MIDFRIRKYDEFKSKLATPSFTETVDSTIIPPNTYSFSEEYQAFHMNDQDIALKGAISVSIGTLYIGDVVEISAEFMNVLGEKGKIAMDFSGGNMFILQSEKYGEFEKIGGKFLVTKDTSFTCTIGIWTRDIGEYYLRNIDINIL